MLEMAKRLALEELPPWGDELLDEQWVSCPTPSPARLIPFSALGAYTSWMSSDRELIVRARAGDSQAFDALIGPLIEPAYRLACGILLDRSAAEDAVQEAALKAWRKLGNVREGAELSPWFLAVVANQCRSLQRGRWWSVLKGVERHAAAGDFDSTDRLDLERGLRQLSPQDRALLVLHYYHDLPLDQAGAILGLSPGAAKSRLYRALRRLRPGVTLLEVKG